MAKALVVDDSRADSHDPREDPAGAWVSKYREAANGKEALEVIDAEGTAVSLVLVDWNMPEMDGLELLKRLRQNPSFLRW